MSQNHHQQWQPGHTDNKHLFDSPRELRSHDYGVTDTLENTDVFDVVVSPEATTKPT
jgi:hypothetical protein